QEIPPQAGSTGDAPGVAPVSDLVTCERSARHSLDQRFPSCNRTRDRLLRSQAELGVDPGVLYDSDAITAWSSPVISVAGANRPRTCVATASVSAGSASSRCSVPMWSCPRSTARLDAAVIMA